VSGVQATDDDVGIGASVRRTEDFRFITGEGRYTDDLREAHYLNAYFLRSDHAHARLLSVDCQDALDQPGVVAILTGQDWLDENMGHLPCDWVVTSRDGSPMKAPRRYPLAVDKVRYVGEPIAVVIAETKEQAQNASERIEVDLEPLGCNIDPRPAQSPDMSVHDEAPDNLCFSWEIGDEAATDAAFETAAHIACLDLVNTRLVANPMEPRAAIALYDAGARNATLYTTSQNPHVARQILAGPVGVAEEHRLRVIAPDVGGGFGTKIFVYPEETVCLWAAKRLHQAVGWTATRGESFLADAHGRDHLTSAELALSEDGLFLGLRVRTNAALGAHLSTFASAVPTFMYGTLLSGQYRTPAIHAVVDAYFTNTGPVDAYRGAGRPEASYVVERLVDVAANQTGIDRAHIRRINFIPPEAFPYQTPVAAVYDSGSYAANLDRAMAMIDYGGFEKRRTLSKAKGKLRGIGIGCYIEACGLAPSNLVGQLGSGIGYFETATVRMTPNGKCIVLTGSHSHGQGHETAFAQIIHTHLGLPLEDVEIVHGDTAMVPYGLGTYGSRSAAVGGSAIIRACEKIITKGRKIAAYALDVNPEAVHFENGVFRSDQGSRTLSVSEVAVAAFKGHVIPHGEMEPCLEESAVYDPENFTYPAGTYICEVEVDPKKGTVKILDFVGVDDFGKVINPMIVEGQVQGGLAQGIGQALMEHCIYDPETGQLLTASFMDYCMPRADDLINFRLEFSETACPHNPLGAKGCGEAGTVAAPPAVMNAVCDAIGTTMDMPATPNRVWNALRGRQFNRTSV